MAGLSDRMIAVAGMVTPGKRVADIGCDHAYTAIYLMEKGIAENVIAMDIGAGPLEIAARNIEAAGFADKIETRLSDGFEKLRAGETDCAVIAGMGGGLIISILEKGSEIIRPGYELVLSPQSDISEVRRYLRKSGHYINKEIIISDQGKMYNIMRVDAFKAADSDAGNVQPNGQDETSYEDIFDEYGEYLLNHPSELFIDHINSEIDKKKALITHLSQCGGDSASGRLDVIKRELGMAEKAKDYIEGTAYGKG